MKWLAGLLLAGALFLVSIETHGQESSWVGSGTVSCAKFEELYRENPSEVEFLFFNWAQGFLSGLNTLLLPEGGVEHANLAPPDYGAERQQSMIRLFCANNPPRPYVVAVLELYDELRRSQGLSNWRGAAN